MKGSVLIFSMEMPAEQLMTRMLSSVGGVPLHDIRSGRVTDQDWARIYQRHQPAAGSAHLHRRGAGAHAHRAARPRARA